MHSAKLDKSDRLQRVFKVLKKYKKLSTREIMYLADVCAVNSCISELRDNGKKIKTLRVGRIWYYRIGGK